MVGLRECVFSGLVKGTIEILTKEASPVVASDHPIWVKHRDHIEDVTPPQFLGDLLITTQVLQHPLSYIRRIGLSRMYPSSNQNNLLIILGHLIISHLQHRHSQPRK